MALKHQLEVLRKSLQQHEQVLDHLRNAPEAEVTSVLRTLRTTADVPSALASIAGRAGSTVQPSAVTTARAILPTVDSDIEFELTTLHESVYPVLAPLSPKSIELEALFPYRPRRSLTPESATRTTDGAVADTTPILVPVLLSPLSTETKSKRRPSDPARIRPYVDRRLDQLDVSYWTQIPISNEFAAHVLSNYFEIYHPVLGSFDTDLFLADLTEHKLNNCSVFLFNALMAHACVSCTVITVCAT
jgi:hypothetical protein